MRMVNEDGIVSKIVALLHKTRSRLLYICWMGRPSHPSHPSHPSTHTRPYLAILHFDEKGNVPLRVDADAFVVVLFVFVFGYPRPK